MSEQIIRDAIANYHLRRKVEGPTPGQKLYLAWYAEMPTCIAEAPSEAEAQQELDAIIVPFMDDYLADGGVLPRPIDAQVPIPKTNIVIVTGIVLGQLKRAVATGSRRIRSKTRLSHKPRFAQKKVS